MERAAGGVRVRWGGLGAVESFLSSVWIRACFFLVELNEGVAVSS